MGCMGVVNSHLEWVKTVLSTLHTVKDAANSIACYATHSAPLRFSTSTRLQLPSIKVTGMQVGYKFTHTHIHTNTNQNAGEAR